MDFVVENFGPIKKRLFQLSNSKLKSYIDFGYVILIPFGISDNLFSKMFPFLVGYFVGSAFLSLYRYWVLSLISKELQNNGFRFISGDSNKRRAVKNGKVYNFSFYYNSPELKFSLIENISEIYFGFNDLDKKAMSKKSKEMIIETFRLFGIGTVIAFSLIFSMKYVFPLSIAPYGKAVVFILYLVYSLELLNRYFKAMKTTDVVLKNHKLSQIDEQLAELNGQKYYFQNNDCGILLTKKV